jgi:hypothetical protein
MVLAYLTRTGPKPMFRTAVLRTTLVLVAFSGGLRTAGAESSLAGALERADTERLQRYSAVRAESIADARAGGAPEDVDRLDMILAGTPQPLLGESLAGDYRCRMAKLGGDPPLTIYGWFRCTIDDDAIGYRLRKVTGSQRMTLHFIDDAKDRAIAYGAGHVADEAPRAYGQSAEHNLVGYLIKAEGGRYRIEFPLPLFESRFDILELERR